MIGVDIDQKAVDFANQNYMSELVRFRRGDAVKLPIEDQSVDVVVSFEMVEHFADQGGFVAEIDRVLRPHGIVIMSSPDREIYSEARHYQNPFHVHEMNKQEFVDLLRLKFPYIQLLDQRAVHGSLIRPLPEMPADNFEEFTTRDGQVFQHLTGVRSAPYFIALAARTPVLASPVSLLTPTSTMNRSSGVSPRSNTYGRSSRQFIRSTRSSRAHLGRIFEVKRIRPPVVRNASNFASTALGQKVEPCRKEGSGESSNT